MLLAAIGALSAIVQAQENTVPTSPGTDKCTALASEDFSKLRDAPTHIMSARLVTAAGETPAHCLVQGYVAPQVGFELKVPSTAWNSKFLEIGCGGSCGTTRAPYQVAWCNDGLRRGYACIVSDRGHRSTNDDGSENTGRDYLWAHNDLQAEIDSGFRAAHVAALAGKAITERYHGAPPKYSYFMGCSGGGRQAMVEVQRFPWDFDGAIAIAPSANYSSLSLALTWFYRSVRSDDGKLLFSPSDLDVLHDAMLAHCDADDGLRDGIITDPRTCKFDPAELSCRRGQQTDCLSLAQVAAARKVYSGPMTSKGERLFYGAMPGSEKGPLGFSVARPTAEFLKYLGFMPDPGHGWRAEDFDFDHDYKRLGMMDSINNATTPDLRTFKARGGKLIMIQGWDDSGSPLPLATIDYYEAVERAMGGRSNAQEFARLFMIPGAEHCIGGPGAGAIDYLSYLERWVEQGRAPDVLIGAHIESDDWGDYVRLPKVSTAVKFSRPHYPYPLQARYRGTGDPNDYRNFLPTAPPGESR